MEQTISFQPDWACKPGDTIMDILKDRELSVSMLAKKIECPTKYVQQIISGKIEIDTDIANKLSTSLGASASFWLNRESQYRESVVRLSERQAWLKEFPIKDMLALGWLKDSRNIIESVLHFFDVPDIATWKKKHEYIANDYLFRTSASFKSEAGALSAWLRQGEIKSGNRQCAKWDKDAFGKTLENIKPLTRKKQPRDFLPELIELCSNCGVALVILRTPTGCKASGATKFLNTDKALLLLSFRHLSDDHFWFTFFHEAGHLMLHSHKKCFIEGISKTSMDEENEANLFAESILIPFDLEKELANLTSNKRDIIEFANRAGISPGILVGQLQHRGYFRRNYSNSFKRWFDWDDINSVID